MKDRKDPTTAVRMRADMAVAAMQLRLRISLGVRGVDGYVAQLHLGSMILSPWLLEMFRNRPDKH